MRRVIGIFLLALALTGPAKGEEADIRGVISNQIEAFQADDFARAFTYASPMIQDIFKTPDRFGHMVREGYPMVWRPAEVTFLDLERVDGVLWQNVRVRDQSGQEYLLGYDMIMGENGWKINGVRIQKATAGMV